MRRAYALGAAIAIAALAGSRRPVIEVFDEPDAFDPATAIPPERRPTAPPPDIESRQVRRAKARAAAKKEPRP